MLTQYLDAMVAHDPSLLPLADDVRFTEDSAEMPLGEGMWADTTGVTDFRQDYLDVANQTAATHVLVEEDGLPVMLTARLKVDDGKVSEIETMAVRGKEEGILWDLDHLSAPHAEMMKQPAADELEPREEAIRIAEYYPAGLKIGSFVDVDAPFAEDAYRLENGFPTAGGECTREGCENIKTQRIIEHPDITYEVKAVDEDKGVVLLRLNFGDTGNYGEGNALIVWEAFKVYGGQIHAVEAFMEAEPADTPSGWGAKPLSPR